MDKLYPILTQMKTSLDELEAIMIEEVNQLNRIKLMLSSARRAMHSGAAQDAEALPMAR